MFCTHCGSQLRPEDRFCSQCGAAQNPAATPTAARRLVRPHQGRKIAGVALGMGYYFDLDVTLIRILWVVVTLLSGGLLLVAYVAAWILMPEEDPRPAAVGSEQNAQP